MELPRYLRAVHGREELLATLAELCAALGFGRVALASGTTVTREVACGIAAGLEIAGASPVEVAGNSEDDVERLAASPLVRETDALIAVGGGKTVDVAKSACERAGRPVIVVPTQLTADGIASPVSVIRTRSGRFDSRHARLPIAVVVDMEVIAAAPAERSRAGLGDLLANPCALRDWRRSAAAGGEEVDDFAALLAQAASDLVLASDLTSLGRGRPEHGLLERLLNGLVLSGLAMEIAGSSRPCSGSEHLVSHALDRLRPGTATHGEQVAFGALVCSRLQDEDWRPLRAQMAAAGMERALRGFDLPVDVLVEAFREAPATRPGRYTVLDEADLSEAALRAAMAEVLTGDPGDPGDPVGSGSGA
jgi:glycerol-1-phosphate dehydrogenase [NAD(P)+]